MRKILTITIIFTFIWFLSNPTHGQQPPAFDWEELIYSENHFSLQFIYGRSPKAVINPDPNIYNIGTKSYESLEGGIGYHYSINKQYSIQTGIRWGGIMRDIRYYIPGTAFTPPLGYDIQSYKTFDKYGVVYFRAPFFIERRFFAKPGRHWNIQAGASLAFSFQTEEINTKSLFEPGRGSIQFVYGRFTPNNDLKPWLNYHVGGGVNLLLKNKDILRVNLVGELSRTKFFRGYYSFTIPGKPAVQFDYGVTGSYIGLETSYIRTKAKKKYKSLRLQ